MLYIGYCLHWILDKERGTTATNLILRINVKNPFSISGTFEPIGDKRFQGTEEAKSSYPSPDSRKARTLFHPEPGP